MKIVFSRRGGMDYTDFQNYMEYLKKLQEHSGSRFPLCWDHIDVDAIEAVDHARSAGLQLADIVASSFFQAVEPNPVGGFEPRYAQELRPVVVRPPDGHRLNYGVKPVPSLGRMSLTAEQRAFFESWREGGQAPGP